MSVTAQEAIRIQLYQNVDPPGDQKSPYPVGQWTSQRLMTGDGTGGIINFIAAPVNAAEGARYLWSIEEAHLYCADVAADSRGGILITTGERFVDGGGGVNSGNSFPYVGMQRGFATAGGLWSYSGAYQPMRYIHQPTDGLTNNYQGVLDVNTNGATYRWFFWGYVWLPNARQQAGGPRRWP